jgi:hypothetical protein
MGGHHDDKKENYLVNGDFCKNGLGKHQKFVITKDLFGW